MSIDRGVIDEIVTEIWSSMLDFQLSEAGSGVDQTGHRQVRAAVQLTGGWEGTVVIECDQTVARVFTAAMTGADESPGDAEVQDVMGELANMIGGNLKAVIGAPTQLSMPTVVVGTDLDLSVLGATELVHVSYACGGGVFSILVMSRDADVRAVSA